VPQKSVENGAFSFQKKVLAHSVFFFCHQECNDLVEVAAKDWKHLFVFGFQKVLDEHVKQACVPLGQLSFLFLFFDDNNGLFILSIGLL